MELHLLWFLGQETLNLLFCWLINQLVLREYYKQRKRIGQTALKTNDTIVLPLLQDLNELAESLSISLS